MPVLPYGQGKSTGGVGDMVLASAQTVTGVKTFNTGTLLDKGSHTYDVKGFGAKGDTRFFADGVATAASTSFTSATATFTTGDTGKSITIKGAGASSASLSTTITFVNATTVTLGTAATTAVSPTVFVYGTDDTAAINSAVTAATSSTDGGGVVFLGNGDYYISGAGIAINSLTVSLVGNGTRQVRLRYVGSGACITWRLTQIAYTKGYGNGSAAVPSLSSSFGTKIQNVTVDGSTAQAGAIGIEYGDINGARLDEINVQGFNGVGSIGIHVNNIYTWTEEALWTQVTAVGNTTGILFDRQNRTDTSITLTAGSAIFTDATCTAADVGKTIFVVGTSAYLGQIFSVVGSTVTTTVVVPAGSGGVQSLSIGGTTSWDYHKIYGIWIGANNLQTGIKLQNGGELAASVINVNGNCGYQNNSSIFLWVTSGAFISNNSCHFGVENDGNANSGTFIQIDSGSSMHMNGTVYAGNFGQDVLTGTFRPSGSWRTPSTSPETGALFGRTLEVYGGGQTGTYPNMGTDGGGGAIVSNAARTDTVTVTNGSTTISDVSIVQADVGKQVLVVTAGTTGLVVGNNIGTVVSVIQGVSFVISTALGTITTGSCTLNLIGYAIVFRPQGAGSSAKQMSLTYSGTFNLPSGINTVPTGSTGVTLVLGTPLQNNGNDAMLMVYLSITANTSLVIKAGVANSSTGATSISSTIITGSTAVGIVPVSLYVPNAYFGTVSFTGTGTVTVMGSMYTYA